MFDWIGATRPLLIEKAGQKAERKYIGFNFFNNPDISLLKILLTLYNWMGKNLEEAD